MKILVNLNTLTADGIMILWLKKFQELAKKGHFLDIFYHHQFHSFDLTTENIYQFHQKYIKPNPPPIIRSKIKFIFYSIYCNFRSFLKTHQTKNYDLIYTPSSVLDLVIWPFIITKKYSHLAWATVFDNIVPKKDPGNPIIRFLAWFFEISLFFIKQADIIFAISPDLKDFLISRGFDPKKIIITGNGVETDMIKAAKPKPKYALDGLFIGRINETKGIFDMLLVLKTITKTYPDFKLGIMGRGDQATETKFLNQIDKLKLKQNIKLLGYISGLKKFEIIKSSKSFWFLSVSSSESFGIALMEAVSSGVYGFVYNLPIFQKIYQHHEVYFSPTGDIKTVADQIVSLFKSKKFVNYNGKKLLGRYSWPKIIALEHQAITQLNKSTSIKDY
jgi:glycosyltransferase involved in cell wall biosynthesis